MPNRLPIAAMSVEIPTEQSVLESFTLSRLLDLARLFGCEIHEPSMSKDRLVGRLGRHLQGTLPALLGELSRDELRLACRRHGFFAEPKDTGRERERKGRLDLVRNLILLERRANDANRTDKERQNDVAAASTVRDELMTLADEARGKLTPFHWWLEFPEVFFEERPDPLQGGVVNGAALMEGVVGNPSFLGGSGSRRSMAMRTLVGSPPSTVRRPRTLTYRHIFSDARHTYSERTGRLDSLRRTRLLRETLAWRD